MGYHLEKECGWLRYAGGQDHGEEELSEVRGQDIRSIMNTNIEITADYGRNSAGRSYNQELKSSRSEGE